MDAKRITNRLTTFIDNLSLNIEKYDEEVFAIFKTINEDGVKIVKETLPKNVVGRTNNNMIQLSSLIDMENIDFSYALLHEYYHIVERTSRPLTLDPEVRVKETADFFAEEVISKIYERKSIFTYEYKK